MDRRILLAPKVVQRQLRHSDARTTLEICGHVVGDAHREVIEKAARLWGAQLQHSDPRITLGLYAHVVPQSQRDAVEGLANALGSGQLLTQQFIADLVSGKSFVS